MVILRSYQLMKGTRPLIDNIEDNKEIVLALREIAAGKVRYKKLTEEEKKSIDNRLF